MNMPRRHVLFLVGVLLAVLPLVSAVSSRQPAVAQTPAPSQTWQVLVNNVSPEGRNWSFNAFYPDQLQVHPGDTIVFTLAPNSQAFHTVTVLYQPLSPLDVWAGFDGGFAQPNPLRRDTLQSTFFQGEALTGPGANAPECGRAGAAPCVIDAPFPDQLPCNPVGPGPCPLVGHDPANEELSCGVLVNPPPSGGQGNKSCTFTIAQNVLLGPYFVVSLVDGPSMSARIDVLPANVPVQSHAAAEASAQRQYNAHLAWLAGQDRTSNPPQESLPDGTKIWSVAAGGGSPNPRLSINEFFPAQIAVFAGDTVRWTNNSPSVVPHTVSGFAGSVGGAQPDQNPFQPECVSADGVETLPPPGSFPPDIWNTCPTFEANNFTAFSLPSAPSGSPYTEGARTSGILLNQEYLDSPTGDGLPFSSSYAVSFPNTGTYAYVCELHPGMEGVVIVLPNPTHR